MRFQVKAPDGRTVVFEGDSQPTDADLDEIFANLPAKQQQQEPLPNSVKWAVNRMAKEGRTEPSLLENLVVGLSGAGQGSSDALQSVGEGMAQGATLGAYGYGADALANAIGRDDLSYSSRKKDREDKYGAWEKGIHTASEIAGAIPTGRALYKGVGSGLGMIPKYGSGLADGVIAKTLTGTIEGGIHGGFTDGTDGAVRGAVIGGAIPVAIAGIGAGIKYAGKGAKNLLGLYTGTSADSVGQAYDAGKRGSKVFLNNMRGKEKVENVLDDVQEGMKQLKGEAQRQYNAVKPGVFGDKTRLDPKPIKTAFNEVKDSLLEGGQKYQTGGTTDKTLRKIGRAVDEFVLDQPNHNAKGFDAFKQRIGDILDDTPYEAKNARRVVGAVYNATKNTIGKQAPKYYELTSKYSEAMDDIADLQKAFSLKGGNTNVDTALRKIQSVMRNNVNTNYGKRLELLDKLYNSQEIKDKVAGQFMKDVLPKGMARTVAGGIGGAGALTLNPATIPVLAASSPRLVGETAYKAGQLATKAKPLSELIMEAQKTGVLPYVATMKGE